MQVVKTAGHATANHSEDPFADATGDSSQMSGSTFKLNLDNLIEDQDASVEAYFANDSNNVPPNITAIVNSG